MVKRSAPQTCSALIKCTFLSFFNASDNSGLSLPCSLSLIRGVSVLSPGREKCLALK